MLILTSELPYKKELNIYNPKGTLQQEKDTIIATVILQKYPLNNDRTQ